MSNRIGLVGCVKKKLDTPARAESLYVSTLFNGRRSYVERFCDEWWIISAKHGLVSPDEILEPYDLTLKKMGRDQRRTWSLRVLTESERIVSPGTGDTIEIHAGSEYRDFGLVEGLLRLGCIVENPTERLTLGEQLRFYRNAQRAWGQDG